MNSLPRARGAGQPRRTPIKTCRPGNAQTRVAAVLYQDAQMGRVAVSIRSQSGLMDASNCINWDCGVIDQLTANGCQWLECHIRDTSTTYRATISTLLTHGQKQHRFGLQWALHTKFWSVDGQPSESERQAQQPTREPAVSYEQPALFDLGSKRMVYR